MELTSCRADAGSKCVAQDVLLAVVEGEGTRHVQALPGEQAGVRAAGEGDVLPQAVGQGLVGGARNQDVLPLSRGCRSCWTARETPSDVGEPASAEMLLGCCEPQWERGGFGLLQAGHTGMALEKLNPGLSMGSYLSWSSGRAPCREQCEQWCSPGEMAPGPGCVS